jgi:glucokinase
VKEIADHALYGEEAKKMFADFGNDLGNFLAPLLTGFDANCLVIGGNIAGAYALFGPWLENALEKHNINIEIVISELMELAAMTGSARLLDEEFWKEVEPLVSKI